MFSYMNLPYIFLPVSSLPSPVINFFFFKIQTCTYLTLFNYTFGWQFAKETKSEKNLTAVLEGVGGR